MPQFQLGDVIRWRGLHGHEGVIVGFYNGRFAVDAAHCVCAAVCYADNPEEVKDARLSDLHLAEGPISEDMQSFIDGTMATWLAAR